eukprot:sb/3469963/
MAPDKLRPGVEAAIKLWKSNAATTWEDALNSYSDCKSILSETLSNAQSKISKESFLKTDSWMEKTLAKSLKSDGEITLDQLTKLMVWKLQRGQFRATLMGLIKRNSDKTVRDVFSKALKQLFDESDVTGAMKTLTELSGVGPATASLILSIASPDKVPFMSDEAMDAVVGLPRKYTMPQFEKFRDLVSKKAKKLGDDWTLVMVENALFATAVLARY